MRKREDPKTKPRNLFVNLIYICSRYEVLSDPQKRSIYDARGEAGLSESGGMGGMDPQVRSLVPYAVHPKRMYSSLTFRTYSVNYSVAVVSSVVVAPVREIRGHARPRTSSIGYRCLWRTCIKARQPS
jgi:hypothetical protein